MAPTFQQRFWEPHVKAALASSDPLNALFNVNAVNEPTAGAYLRGSLEPGSFVDRPLNPRFSSRGAIDAIFANGAVRVDDGQGRRSGLPVERHRERVRRAVAWNARGHRHRKPVERLSVSGLQSSTGTDASTSYSAGGGHAN
jgi:hypothetical protein